MSTHGWMPVLCVLFILFISSHANDCNDIDPTIEQLDYVYGYDMHFRCSYNTMNATLLHWTSRREADGTPATQNHVIYTAYLSTPNQERSSPAVGYKTKLKGLHEDFAHVLIIKNVLKEENFNTMRCIVYSTECTVGAQGKWDPFFADPQFAAVAMLIDGKVRTREYISDEPVNVTCSAQSDPKAELSIADVATSQTCERLAGEPPTLWNCSVSATLLPKGERDVSCRVTWNGVVQPSDTVRIIAPSLTTLSVSGAPTGVPTGGATGVPTGGATGAPTAAPTGTATTSAPGGEIIDGQQAQAQIAASSSVIIGAVVAVVAVLIIAAVVGIVVYRKKKQRNAEDKGSLT